MQIQFNPDNNIPYTWLDHSKKEYCYSNISSTVIWNIEFSEKNRLKLVNEKNNLDTIYIDINELPQKIIDVIRITFLVENNYDIASGTELNLNNLRN
jgi:hypothetical protein